MGLGVEGLGILGYCKHSADFEQFVFLGLMVWDLGFLVEAFRAFLYGFYELSEF